MSKRGCIQPQKERPSKEYLENLYLKDKMTIRQMAALCDVNPNRMSVWLSEVGIPKKNHYTQSTIPVDVFAPVLQGLVENWRISPLMADMTPAGEPHKKGRARKLVAFSNGRYEIIAASMSEAIRVSARRFSSILNGEQQFVDWKTVDKLLCFFERVDLWYQPPLSDYYWEGNEPPEGWERTCDLAGAIAGMRG